MEFSVVEISLLLFVAMLAAVCSLYILQRLVEKSLERVRAPSAGELRARSISASAY